MFLQGKVSSARYITQEGESAGQRTSHMAAATQHPTHCGVQQLPWPARTLDLSPIEPVWDTMKRELTLSPEPARTIAELRQRVLGTVYAG